MSDTEYKFIYFVSYLFNQEGKSSGYGCTEILTTLPITDFETIMDICSTIAENNRLSGIAILNYQLLRIEQDENNST